MTDHDEAPSPGLSEQIRQRLADFSPAERRVARALLAGPPGAGLGSSAHLAELAKVSGPTVSRFASRLGFASYGAFQQAMRGELAARVMSPVDVYRQQINKNTTDPLGQAGQMLGQAVERSIQGLPAADVDRATTLLADSRHQVLATGGWFSHLIAGYFTAMLREFRPGVRLVEPIAAERAAAIADLDRRAVVVVFDYRRYERDTQEFARAARAAGAHIILFTDPWLSPLADAADAILPIEVAGPAPFESVTPTVAVVETLLTEVARALGDTGHRRFEQFGGVADRWIHPWSPTNDNPEHGEPNA